MSKGYPKPRKWIPKNPEKYKGDYTNIVARSSWEVKCFNYMDRNPEVIEWSSEEFIIPYKSPVDGKLHRYFPDIIAKMRSSDGRIKTYMIEIKPFYQTQEPQMKKRITKQYINEVCTYGVNTAKWKAAKIFCTQKGWEFLILTEKQLFGE